MSGFNPRTPWSELERRLSDRPERSSRYPSAHDPEGMDAALPVSVGSWGTRPDRTLPDAPGPHVPAGTPYAELHVHSDFSFLDGASEPEELVEQAVAAGLTGLALTDHNGLYGAPRFAAAAGEAGLATVFGSELSIGLTDRIPGQVDPEAEHLLVLARGVDGYRRLSAAITTANVRGEKNRPVFHAEELYEETRTSGAWQLLTGCRKGPLARALADPEDPDGGLTALRRLRDAAGRDNLAVELTRHGLPDDDERIRHLTQLADRTGLPVVATNAVHYATRARHRDAQVRAAVRSRRSLDALAGWLPPTASARIRSGEEMLTRFPRAAVAHAARIAAEAAFSLRAAAPRLPTAPIPAGRTEAEHLRGLVVSGARHRYGSRESAPRAWAQIDRELDTIESMGFCGYFLIVWDIARFCRTHDIFCQGRGSAANSAVCYVLGITAVDAVRFGLLFDRFLAPDRQGYPDIDIDIESDKRERVIQYVYDHYGRDRAAQVANVITYRPRSAIRDAASALGYAPGQQDAFSKGIRRWSSLPAVGEPVGDNEDGVPAPVLDAAAGLLGTPRHLGIHSGGMILADRPIGEVVPIEPATMPGRTVVQWDKDDCAAMDLVKFDLLGLGMLTALHESIDLIARHTGERIDRAALPQEDPKVFDMLCAADAVGVFQVESRAQIGTLPRLAPRSFYDLAVQVALIRPGPIQGGSVHPYIRRRQGKEEVTYLHPLLRPSLEKTCGVPLFQEQLMQMAMDVGGFSGADADELRRAMGSRRSRTRMRLLSERFHAGAAARGVDAGIATQIFDKIAAFANYGFPESHAISFANLVYDSAWLKRHHHAAFTAGLLRAQPMGFYSPQSLLADARRHGVGVRPVDVNASQVLADLEEDPASGGGWPDAAGGLAIRVGLASVRDVGKDAAEVVVTARAEGPFSSVGDLAQRTGLPTRALEGLATAGAFATLGLERREALWVAGGQAGASPATLPGTSGPETAPALPGMDAFETTLAELWATGVTVDGYPTEVLRETLQTRGYGSTRQAREAHDGTRVTIAGIVTHRQRPSTADGITFFNLEDEFGMLNVVCTRGLMQRHRRIALTQNVLAVTGLIQRADGAQRPDGGPGEPVVSLYAHRLTPIATEIAPRARDFR